MEVLVELREVLVNAENYPWDDSLFLPKDKNWSLESKCAVLNMNDLEDEEELPAFAIDSDLIFALNIQEVQDIVINANQQRPNCSHEDLLEAFLYYYKKDAFIVFNK